MSDNQISQCTFTWRIENFSFCYQNTGEGLCSPSFSFGSTEKNWFLCLYPRGETEETAEFIACFLHRAFLEECNIKFKFRLELIGASGKRLKKLKGNSESSLLYRWGNSEFLAIQQWENDSRNKEGDVLTVRCQLLSRLPTEYSLADCTARTMIDINRVIFKMAPFYEHGVINSKEQLTFPGGACFECAISYIDDTLEVKIVKLKSRDKIGHFVEIKLTFQHGEGREICSQTATHFFKSENHPETWQFPHFESLVDGNQGSCARNAATHLQWEFTISSGTKSNIMTNQIESNNGSSIDANSWQKDMRSIFLNKNHCDVKLRVDSKVVDCHETILAARSPVFSAMFGQSTMRTHVPIYDIFDIDFDALKLFLEFLYTDTVNEMDFGKAKKLLIAAEKYQVLSLEEKCFTFLSSEISVESVCEVLYAADRANHDRLKSAAMDFIVVNAEDILPLPHWQEWMKNNTQLAAEVLSELASNVSTLRNTKFD